MVLGGECSQGKALGVIIPETNTSLGSGPMGYYYSQITGEKKRKLPGGHGGEWTQLPSVFPPYVGIKLLELMLSTPLTSSQAEAPPQGSSVATGDEPLKFTRVLMSPYLSLISVAE